MTVFDIINQESRSIERRIVDRLWECGYSEEDVLNLKGKDISDPLRIKVANLLRDKEREFWKRSL